MTPDPGPAAGSSLLAGLADRLSTRFALVLALALLPLGIVSLVQTRDLQAEIQRRNEAALLGETLRSAAGEIGIIRNAQGIVATLAASLPVMTASDACPELMRSTALQIPTATLVAFLPKSGLMTCSSVGRVHDFSDSVLFRSVLQSQAPGFVVDPNGPVSGTSVLGVSHPVFGKDGTYMGFVSISLPHDGLERLDQAGGMIDGPGQAPLVFWTFDRDGKILTASNGLDRVAGQLPKSRSLIEFIDLTDQVFQDYSATAELRTYAVVPIVRGQLYLMSSWDVTQQVGMPETRGWRYLPPITMWMVGLIVAGLTSERLVTRHIRVLSTSISRFARGDRGLRQVDLRAAPVELRELGDAFQTMTHSITRGEAELEDSIHQKEVLLREVHHRVKNNLQLIASIMNIQMRKAIAPEAKLLLKGLQERVMSLATIHRGLYLTSGLADVRADELFSDIVRQIVNMSSGPGKKFAVDVDVDDLHMTPDQAVPLSLLLTEAMTNAMKYAGAAAGQPVRIGVRLKREEGSDALLSVTNSLAPAANGMLPANAPPQMTSSTGLGEQLLTAFAQQIGGTLDREITDHSFRLSVRFSVTELNTAENQTTPPAADDPSARF